MGSHAAGTHVDSGHRGAVLMWVVFVAAIAILAVAALLSAEAAAGVEAPSFYVDPGAVEIGGGSWGAGQYLEIGINDAGDGTGDADEFTTFTNADGGGFFGLDLADRGLGFGIEVGDRVTVSGATTKIHYVRDVRIQGFSMTADTVWGEAGLGATVTVNAYEQGGSGSGHREATADLDMGSWMVDFIDGVGPDFDLKYGSTIHAFVFDADNDTTRAIRNILNPNFGVQPINNSVWGGGYPAEETVTITIDDSGNGVGVDHTTYQPCDEGGNFGVPDVGFDVDAGDVVTVSNGIYVREHITRNLHVGGVEVVSDVVTGTADPGTQVSVWLQTEGDRPHREATATGEGVWSASFAESVSPDPWGQPYDLGPGLSGYVEQRDDDGDVTHDDFGIPNPCFQATVDENRVCGWEWAAAPASALIEIDDLDTGVGVDRTKSVACDGSGWFDFTFEGEDEYDIQPGMIITVSDGSSEKELAVADIVVADLDTGTDTISGTAEPSMTVQVCIQADGLDEEPMRFIEASNTGGNWTADFTQTVNESDWGQPYDLRLGDDGSVNQFDPDGDQTQIGWRIPRPAIGVDSREDGVWGSDWLPSTDVTVTIDDTTTGGVDYSVVLQSDRDGNIFQRPLAEGPGGEFDIRTGMVVTVTDGESTKDHTVLPLTLDGLDTESDLVTGTAAPGSVVHVVINYEGEQPMRWATANGVGVWVADFGEVASEYEWGRTWDLKRGDSGMATQYEVPDDGDHTQIDWRIDNCVVMADPLNDRIRGNEWYGTSLVTVTIDDPATPASPDATHESETDQGWWEVDYAGMDVKAGHVVRATDGNITKTTTVTALMVDVIDEGSDTVSGTAAPSSTFSHWMSGEGAPGGDGSAGVDGRWSIDYGALGGDITRGSSGTVQQRDEDDDSTEIEWSVRATRVGADPHRDSLSGQEWPREATVTVTLDKPGTPQNPDSTMDVKCDWNGSFRVSAPDGVPDVEVGDTVTGADGTTIRELLVEDLAVTFPDPDTDLVHGTAPAGRDLWVQTWTDPEGRRGVTASGAGTWTADFSVPFGTDWGSDAIDLVPGTYGQAALPDADGDETICDWYVPDPTVSACSAIPGDRLRANRWPPLEEITFSVDTVDAGTAPNFVTTLTVDHDGNGETEDLGYDLFVGDVITASGGGIERVLTIAPVHVTGVNADDNTVAGTASAGAHVRVWMPEQFGEGPTRDATATSTGTWEVDFDDGDSPNDIRLGDIGEAYQIDADGDRTWEEWKARASTTFTGLSASKVLTAYGDSYTFSGKLMSGATALSGKTVVLQQSFTATGTYTDVGTGATTNASGAFSFTVKPYWKRYYRVRFAGDDDYLAATSAYRYALPRAWASTPVAPASMRTTVTATVWGYLKPWHPANRSLVRIYRYRYYGGKWVAYSYVWAKTSNYLSYSKYAASVRLPYKGYWRLRAYAPADAWHAAAWSSAYDTVLVK